MFELAFIDLPQAIHERVSCTIAASLTYKVPANVLLAVAEVEGGAVGQWVKNSNDTHDVGPMQFNTTYLDDLKRYGISASDVEGGGCYPYELAAWRIARHIAYDKRGDVWQRAANYHSKTPKYNQIYRAKLLKAGAKWTQWLNKHYPTQIVNL